MRSLSWNRPNKEHRILTKGDNNPVDDRGLYPRGQLWIKESQIMGQVVGYFISHL